MTLLSLLSSTDVQQQLAESIQLKRKRMKFSRRALAERSTVPATSIKKFETTGQISLRQFILLWQCVDQLETLSALTKECNRKPCTISESILSHLGTEGTAYNFKYKLE